MTDKNQLLLAIIGTAFLLGGWLSMDIRELRANVDRNAAAIAKNAESIARLEGILIGDNRPVSATTTPPSSDPAQTALN